MNQSRLKGICLLMLALVSLIGCGSKSDQKEGAGPEKKNLPVVLVKPARIAAISENTELTGNIVAAVTARLASPAEGPIKQLKVREGDLVKKGAILLRIGRTEGADASLLATQANFRKEEEELKATEALVKSGAIPGEQLDKVRANYAVAKAQLIKAQESLEDYVIRSPWEGIVSKVLVTDGFYVSPRMVLIEMFDPSSLVLQFAVPETIVPRVTRNTRIEAVLDAYPDRKIKASIRRIYPELDLKTRSRLIETSFGEKVNLVPGMFARLKVILQTVPEAIVVPSEAVISMPDESKVLYLVREGKAVKVKVKTGLEENGSIQIMEGISAGDVVVVAGHERLKEGAEVKIAGEKGEGPKSDAKKGGA